MAVFPLDGSSSDADVSSAALACARTLLNLAMASPAPGEPPLTLHVALHAGTVAEMHVGDGHVSGRFCHLVRAYSRLNAFAVACCRCEGSPLNVHNPNR